MIKRKSVIISFISYFILFASCETEELPVPAHQVGEVISVQVDMMPDYRYQLFFDMERGTVISQNLKTAWDLGFEASENGWHIILNTSRGGAAANTGNTDFDAVTGITDVAWNWDLHTGNLDSTAIGNWRSKAGVYLVDRGYSPTGDHTGYRKMIFQSYDTQKYTLRLAQLDGSGDTILIIPKDTTVNFVCLSFDNGDKITSVEPPKTDWDICFTQYLHIFPGPGPSTFLVTGVLHNRYKVTVATDTVKSFAGIRYDDVAGYTFNTSINTIGYNWKEYDYGSATYNIFPEKNYIILTTEGLYYKLHFTDFYNETGDKGSPKFEMQKL